ncbi:MAG TPA: hypothetical protein VFV10_18120 [Gammaproteobacteria bacterium]|nr:hypothetical protein [Gammaproteobacteria bacterium]
MRIAVLILAAVGGALVVGCSKQPAPSAQSEDAAPSESTAPDSGSTSGRSAEARAAQGTVFAPLVNDLDRARGVQNTVDEQAERLKKEIEKGEGGGDGDR